MKKHLYVCECKTVADLEAKLRGILNFFYRTSIKQSIFLTVHLVTDPGFYLYEVNFFRSFNFIQANIKISRWNRR
ncbi:hypothetical protein Hanom_Chr12g01089981 [Helianthus anomalus]